MQNSLKDLVHKHLQPIFDAYDKNSNSLLDKSELTQMLADNLGVEPAPSPRNSWNGTSAK